MNYKSGVFYPWIAVAIVAVGCNSQPTAEKPAKAEPSSDSHDHDHGHEHADHDHADEHKHEAGHEHADHADTYAGAVAKIAEMNAAVAVAAKEGELAKADGTVHDIGHLLEELTELAGKEGFSDSQKDTIKQKADDLMEVFGEIDSQIHGGDGKPYDQVAERISDALTTLNELAPAAEK